MSVKQERLKYLEDLKPNLGLPQGIYAHKFPWGELDNEGKSTGGTQDGLLK